jgi:hypothetical protein
MQRKDLPIIVGGCHRSGTSLMRRILNAHSRIHCGPEIKFLRDLHGDYHADPLRHGRFLRSARALAPENELLEVLGRAFITLHERAAARAGKARWADKNPENVLYWQDWERLLGHDWLFVHMVRHPLDTLASMKEANFPFALPSGLEGRIGHYRQCLLQGQLFGKTHPDRYHLVRYEELARLPRRILELLMKGLGETLEPIQLSFNEVAHEKGLEDPKVVATRAVHGDSIGRWARELTAAEVRTIWEAIFPLWKQFDPEARADLTEEGVGPKGGTK